eukprot:TRINITY_DN993_c0_g1_i10.p1 TRINITY_DN993_c0_g1~~TRINITY_DN993_c0_g1_i10.p1  ORF type:complete len:510 (+),score=44.13 TRINITY_DN993_c0_g1_i10:30-1559(+)
MNNLGNLQLRDFFQLQQVNMMLRLLLAFVVLFTSAQPQPFDESIYYKQVLSCSPNYPVFTSPNDRALNFNTDSFNVTVEMHVDMPDFAGRPANLSDPNSYRPKGSTRINATYPYQLLGDSVEVNTVFFDEPCRVASTGQIVMDASDIPEFGENLRNGSEYLLGEFEERLLNMSTGITLDQSKKDFYSYIYGDVFLPEIIFSAGLADESGSLLVCCELQPVFPTFPDTFSAVVEANILEKGFSIIVYEYYSYEDDKVRQDSASFQGDIVTIQDFDFNIRHMMYMPNVSEPNGYCEDASFRETEQTLFIQENGHVVNSKQFLLLSRDAEIRYEEEVPPPVIRGVPCEKWSYDFSLNGTGFMGIKGSYTVEMYFAHVYWRIARNVGTRQLMRIKLLGQGDTQVEHIYEYIDFKPYIEPYVKFEPCDILPKGRNCNCSVESNSDKTCSGFPSEQAGQYILFLFVGLIVGVGLGIFVWIFRGKYFRGVTYKEFIASPAAAKGVEMQDTSSSAGI